MEKDNQSTQEINSQAQNPLGIAPVGGLIAEVCDSCDHQYAGQCDV